MLEVTQVKHSSQYTKPTFLPDISVKSTLDTKWIIEHKAENRVRQILGPISMVQDAKKPERSSIAERRVRLSFVISILDFEYAASQNIPPAAFACERCQLMDINMFWFISSY